MIGRYIKIYLFMTREWKEKEVKCSGRAAEQRAVAHFPIGRCSNVDCFGNQRISDCVRPQGAHRCVSETQSKGKETGICGALFIALLRDSDGRRTEQGDPTSGECR